MKPKQTRRGLLAGIASLLGLNALTTHAAAAVVTPSTAEGPFYPLPNMRVADADNDLVKIIGQVKDAGGEVITLKGTITDTGGKPRKGHRIEIWQCDLNGKYLHPGDDQSVTHDESFQGFGHDISDENGNYVFRTIKPATYPGRTPHIHVKVFDGDRELLTTQFYIKDHPLNARDFLFNRMSVNKAESVSMDFISNENGLEANVDVVI